MTRPLILVVEDDLSVRGPLEKFLTLHGFDVISADTAEAGQQRLQESRISGAVIDLRLRQGSGREVVLSIPPPTPVVIFSAVPEESGRLEQIRLEHAADPEAVLAGDAGRNAAADDRRGRAEGSRQVADDAGARAEGRYRIFWPSAEEASSTPRIAVVLRSSRIGLTSTRSSARSRPESATISISMCASR